MRVAVLVVFVSVLTTSSEASKSCMSKTEARQHFGSVHIYWHGSEHCWDATPTRRHHQIHKVQQKIDPPKWHDSMSEMLLPDEQPARMPWADRWVDIEPSPIVSRWVDIVQVASPPVVRKPEPMVTPRSVMVLIIVIALMTVVIVEVLFGSMRSAGALINGIDRLPGGD
jgi:hypothetical protein